MIDMGNRILSEAEIQWAFNKWLDGYSLRQISAVLFVSQPTVTRSLQRRGLRKVVPDLLPPTWEELKALETAEQNSAEQNPTDPNSTEQV